MCHIYQKHFWGIWWFHRSKYFEAMKAGKSAIWFKSSPNLNSCSIKSPTAGLLYNDFVHSLQEWFTILAFNGSNDNLDCYLKRAAWNDIAIAKHNGACWKDLALWQTFLHKKTQIAWILLGKFLSLRAQQLIGKTLKHCYQMKSCQQAILIYSAV